MLSLKDRLSLVEGDFLSALVQGGDAIITFNLRWETLVHEVDIAMESDDLDDETAALAHSVASRCATLAGTSAELFASYDSLTSELLVELDMLMSDLTIREESDIHTTATTPFPSNTPPRTETALPKPSRSSRKRSHVSEAPSSINPPSRKRRRATLEESGRNVSPAPSLPQSSSSLLSARYITAPCASPNIADANQTSRKRRLSESDSSPSPLGFKRLRVGPRLHAVSDSFVARSSQAFLPISAQIGQLDTVRLGDGSFDLFESDLVANAAPSVPVIEVSGDLEGSSFWPQYDDEKAYDIDSFMQSLFLPDGLLFTLPIPASPSPSSASTDSSRSVSPPSYPASPLHGSDTLPGYYPEAIATPWSGPPSQVLEQGLDAHRFDAVDVVKPGQLVPDSDSASLHDWAYLLDAFGPIPYSLTPPPPYIVSPESGLCPDVSDDQLHSTCVANAKWSSFDFPSQIVHGRGVTNEIPLLGVRPSCNVSP